MAGSLPHHLAYFAHLAAMAVAAALILRLTRGAAPVSRKVNILLATGCLAIAALAFRASDPPRLLEDFWIAYYPAGRAVLEDPRALHAVMSKGVDGFVNLPVVAYLFAPLGALPPTAAGALFTLAGLGCLVVAWVLIVRLWGLGRTERWLLALIFAGNGALHYSLKEGNTSHMILVALAASLMLLRGNRSMAAAALLAGAAIIKPPLALFGLFFVLRRDLRGALTFAGVGLAAAAGSVIWFGWAENLNWFQTSVVQFSQTWIAAFNVQSIPAFLYRLRAPGELLLDWSPYPPAPVERLVGQLLTGLLYVAAGVALVCGRRQGPTAPTTEVEQRDLQYLLTLCLAVISSPLSWSHYYVWMLLPAAFLLVSAKQQSRAARRLIFVAIALLTPLIWPLSLGGGVVAWAYGALAVSHLLFGALLIFGVLAWRLAAPVTARSWAFSGSTAAKPTK